MTRPFDLMRRLRAGVASVLLLSATGTPSAEALATGIPLDTNQFDARRSPYA